MWTAVNNRTVELVETGRFVAATAARSRARGLLSCKCSTWCRDQDFPVTEPPLDESDAADGVDAEIPRLPTGDEGGAEQPLRRWPTPWALAEHHTYVSIDRAFKANLARLPFGVGPVALAC